MLPVDWHGERLLLLPQRAVHWPAQEALLLADPHFGKAATFRHAGVPLPGGTTAHDLARLERLLENTGAKRLFVLGDFLHARTGRSPETLRVWAEWREQHHATEIVLVRGNHDRHAGDPPCEWSIECVNEPLALGPLWLAHDEMKTHRRPLLAGHIHPGVTLRSREGNHLRAACYLLSQERLLLPAFGQFTGLAPIEPASDERVFVANDEAVVEIAARRFV